MGGGPKHHMYTEVVWRHIGGGCIVVMSMHAIFVSYER